MATVLVVAGPSARRTAWSQALTDRGYAAVEAPSILQALATLDELAPVAMVYEPFGRGDQEVLGALSNMCDLPPIVMMSAALTPLASRLASVRRLDPRASDGRLVAGVVAAAATHAVPPSRLPLRVCPVVVAQWTVRGRAAAVVEAPAAEDAADGFDGVTQPEGYVLA